MSEEIKNAMETLDDIKEKLTDEEYLSLVDGLTSGYSQVSKVVRQNETIRRRRRRRIRGSSIRINGHSCSIL